MKRLIICLLPVLLFASIASAKKRHDNGLPKTEVELLSKIINCLQYEDTITYTGLFADFDTVWKQVLEYPDTSAKIAEEMSHIRSHPEKVAQFDPYYNHDIVANFYAVVKKGENDHIHWNSISLVRYELYKEKLTRDLIGYEKIAPYRFRGFVFIKDELTRKIYCFTVSEMQQIQGYWYGGQVLNVFEATTTDEYLAKLDDEVKTKRIMKETGMSENEVAAMLHKKTEANADSANEQEDKDDDDEGSENKKNNVLHGLMKKEVVDRKVYKGTFDNEIPIILYIRYLKGNCPEGVCGWEAIYKFGDQDDYIKLDVSKTDDGKWSFTEDPPLGSMELTLKGKTYTGSWLSSDEQTGYDVRLTETILTNKQLVHLDEIMENEKWAKGIETPKPIPKSGDSDVDESFEQGQ
jgi:hypothetical protein